MSDETKQEFFEAIAVGDERAVEEALEADRSLAGAVADVEWTPHEDEGWTALHAAVYHGQARVAQLLVDAGADVDAWSGEPRRPLHDAIEFGQVEIQELLLAAGAEVDVWSAAILGRVDRLLELLAEDPERVDDDHCNLRPLGWAAYGNQPEIAEQLIARGARLDDGALHCAAQCSHVEVTEVLLAKGVDPDERTGEQQLTALHIAATLPFGCDSSAFVKTMLAGGADVNAKDAEGRTPLDLLMLLRERHRASGRPTEPDLVRAFANVEKALREAGGETGAP